MKKRIIWAAAAAAAAAAFLLALFFLVKSKKLQVNRWVVSGRDITGVDISEYQADVDMEKLADQGIQFIYIKATEGSTHVDSRFAQNMENAGKCGLPAGAYHFFSFDSPGLSQAEHFIETVGDLSGKLIPVVDVEYYQGREKDSSPDAEEASGELRAFLDALEAEYHVKPMIYCSRDVYEKYIENYFDGYPRWVRSIYYPATFEAGGNWTVWQYSDTGLLEGYEGGETYIDLDVLKRGTDLSELMVQ